jgi:hypothetical protein
MYGLSLTLKVWEQKGSLFILNFMTLRLLGDPFQSKGGLVFKGFCHIFAA